MRHEFVNELPVPINSGPPSTIQTMIDVTGLNGATAHRFLLTLEDLGAVVRAPQGRFQLGMALADLGGRVSQYKVIADASADRVAELVRVLRETVHVAVLDGIWVIDVAMAEPARSLRMRCITAGKSTFAPWGTSTPYMPASRTAAYAREARMSAFEGTQPTLRQSPPRSLRSTSATRAPRPAAPAAVTRPAVPAPITTRL